MFFVDSIDIVEEPRRLRDQTFTDNVAIDQQQSLQVPDKQLIQSLVSRLVSKAGRLIHNTTTNLAENWIQIRCKFDGGKVINRSQSVFFQFRCYGVGLQKNLGKTWGVSMWEKMTGDYPNEVFVDAADISAKRVEKDRERKATENSKASRQKVKYSHHNNSVAARRAYIRHDGLVEPDDIENDISPEYLDQLKTSYYAAKVVVSTQEKALIEEQTREQSNSSFWAEERTKRITASRVGSIAKMKKTTKKSNKVKELLYSTFRGNKATMYGTLMEDKAREDYIAYQHKENHHNKVWSSG